MLGQMLQRIAAAQYVEELQFKRPDSRSGSMVVRPRHDPVRVKWQIERPRHSHELVVG